MKRKEELERLLIVIDMVNGFINEGIMSDRHINHITPDIRRIIEEMIKENEGIAFVKDTHSIESSEFKKFPPHCIKGTRESQLIDELKQYEQDSLSYEKNSTSIIYAPEFMNDLEKMKKLREIIISGCCTDICILNAAIPLVNYFDQNNMNVKVRVPSNMVETYNSDTHNREEYNEMALKLMKQSGIEVGEY